MCSALKETLKDLEPQYCQFPVPLRRDRSSGYYQSIHILGRDEIALDLREQPKTLERLTHIAWAVLLHTYLVKDIVYYAVFSSPRNGFRAKLERDSADSTGGAYTVARRSRSLEPEGDEDDFEYWRLSQEAFQSAGINTGIWTNFPGSVKPEDGTRQKSIIEKDSASSPCSQTMSVGYPKMVKISVMKRVSSAPKRGSMSLTQ